MSGAAEDAAPDRVPAPDLAAPGWRAPPGARAAGVIGHPVAHSRSPLVHAHWLARHGVRGLYGRADVPPEGFGAFVRAMPERGIAGGNVTLPHKEAALALAAEATAAARAAGAANTLWFSGGRLIADSTDGAGMLAALDEGAPGWEAAVHASGAALVLGAGGAARSAAAALLARGAPRVLVANRDGARAQALAAALDPSRVAAVALREAPAALARAGLLVNATQLGMTGQPPLALTLDGLPEGAAVMDMVYAPLETPLLAAARARGFAAVDGLGMLLHQASLSFPRWFGGAPPAVTPALRALVEADLGAGR